MSRRLRFEGREVARSLTSLDSLSKCGKTVCREGGVQIRVNGAGRAGFAGVSTCGSVHACPVCSSKIMAARTVEVEGAVRAWLAGGEGRSVAMATVTLGHGKLSPLVGLLDGLGAAWARLGRDYQWKKRRQAAGWRFQIRSLEARLGANGWHPHYHVLVFLESRLSEAAVSDLAGFFFARWTRAARAEGLRVARKGMDFRQFDGDADTVVKDAGGYVTKEKYQRGADAAAARAAFEVTRGDLKAGAGSVSPFDILGAIAWHLNDSGGDLDSCGDLVRRWREWERASKGRRALQWSPGMRAALGLDLDEKSDADLAAEEIGTAADALVNLSASAFARLRSIGHAGGVGVLERAESGFLSAGRAGALASVTDYLKSAGVAWSIPDPPPPCSRRCCV